MSIMVYSCIYHKNDISDDTYKLFNDILYDDDKFDCEKYNNIVFCITNCSLYVDYTALEIKNLLYDDICDFIDLHYDTLITYNNYIDFKDYFSDYRSNDSNISLDCLIKLSKFFYNCIIHDITIKVHSFYITC